MKNKKLFLLDAYALIYRAYFAFINNPRISSNGLNTSAVFGFTNSLLEIIKKENPTHLAVVFDTKEATERHIIYPEYKAQREAMPEGIREALPYIDRLLEAFNVSKIFKNGFIFHLSNFSLIVFGITFFNPHLWNRIFNWIIFWA